MITRQDRISLFVMGVVSILVGVVPQIQALLFYPDYGLFSSISASATTTATTSMILPLGLGIVLLFCIVYKGYCKLDNWVTNIIGIGMFFTVVQPVESRWTEGIDRLGLFGMSPRLSTIVHCIGAGIGFAAMVFWVMYLFTRGRNKVRKITYFMLGFISLCALFTFLEHGIGGSITSMFNINDSLIVWILEAALLIPLGVALIIKSDLINTLRNKEKTDD
jgi:hypothetical protein